MESEFTEAFARVIKKHRLAQGITHEKLAELADFHATYISMLERSVRKPQLGTAQRLARALGIPLSKLIAETELAMKKDKQKG